MRAYQNVAMYCVLPDADRKKHFMEHKKRMKNIKGVLTEKDLRFHPSQKPRKHKDSSKISALRYGTEAVIARNNLVLAKRIFEIMEGPGIVSNLMDSDTNTHHPGTINFPHRLAEAKRIHNENLIIASRLDAVKPTYYDRSTVSAVRNTSPSKGCRPIPPRALHQSALNGSEVMQHSVVEQTQSERKPRANNVLLEYTKVQKGRVLDVAVIKEPFRDSYSIFGIDIDNGQRYELKLTADEVSTALEGDILVTSLDNVEVWMALISKVELNPVEAFSKTPLPRAPLALKSCSESKKPVKPTALNSSKNQSNNPRLNRISKEEHSADVIKANTSTSADSSIAINGTDDDFSIPSGDGDELQSNNNESYPFDEEIDTTKEYTLDDYYENNAPLSPLPSQTGFITSAPCGSGSAYGCRKYNEGNNLGSDLDKMVPDFATIVVNNIVVTATKNVLLNVLSIKKSEANGISKVKKSDRNSIAQVPKSNPYTNTKVSVALRSHSITYKQVPVMKEKNGDNNVIEKTDVNQSANQNQVSDKIPPPNDSEITKTEIKEPQKPNGPPPTVGNRRPSHKPKGGNTSRKASKITSDINHKISSQSTNVDNRKKSGAIDSRRKSVVQHADPMTSVKTLPPKVAELAIKTALRRVGGIIELFDFEFDPANM